MTPPWLPMTPIFITESVSPKQMWMFEIFIFDSATAILTWKIQIFKFCWKIGCKICEN